MIRLGIWLLLMGATGATYRTLCDRADRPYVLRDEAGFDRCAPPAAPCPGRRVTVRNPSPRRRTVRVRCLGDRRTDVLLPLGRLGAGVADVGLGVPLRRGDCVIVP